MVLSEIFEVVEKRRNSKASYAENIEVGDIIKIQANVVYSGSGAVELEVFKHTGDGFITDAECYVFQGSSYKGNITRTFVEETDANEGWLLNSAVFIIRKIN